MAIGQWRKPQIKPNRMVDQLSTGIPPLETLHARKQQKQVWILTLLHDRGWQTWFMSICHIIRSISGPSNRKGYVSRNLKPRGVDRVEFMHLFSFSVTQSITHSVSVRCEVFNGHVWVQFMIHILHTSFLVAANFCICDPNNHGDVLRTRCGMNLSLDLPPSRGAV